MGQIMGELNVSISKRMLAKHSFLSHCPVVDMQTGSLEHISKSMKKCITTTCASSNKLLT